MKVRKHILLLAFLISSVSIAILFSLNPQRLPSVYHLYLPTFFHKDSKDVTDEEKEYSRGNLKGVIEKLPYIKSLGVDYLYLSPFFQSPQMDGGYDVSDYQKISPLFGKRDDLERIIDEIPVISDFVLNHTSYQHKWFENALTELKDGKEDGQYLPYYYIFKIVDEQYQPSKTPPKVELLFDLDGKKKGETIDLPWWNDGGLNEIKEHPYTAFSAGDDLAEIAYLGKEREIDGKLQPWIPKNDGKQHYYYLYTFSWFQPDLNWNNSEVRDEIKSYIDFWGKEGIKGFRFDAVSLIGKHREKAIAKPSPRKLEKFLTELNLKRYFSIGELSQDGDSNSDILARVAKRVFNTAYLFDSLSDLYYAEELNGFPKSKAWPRGVDNFREEKNFIEVTKKHYNFDKLNNSNFHTSLIMENHDHIRSVSRFAGNLDKVKERRGDWRLWIIKEWFEPNSQLNTPENVMKRAKALALFEFLQRGIPLIYNGEELGMDNDITTASDKMINGIFSNHRKRFIYSIELQSRQAFLRRPQPNDNESKEILRHNFLNDLGRNSPRTVFQWNSSDNTGFCEDCKMWNGKEEPTLEAQLNRLNQFKQSYTSRDYYIGYWHEDSQGNMKLNRNWEEMPDADNASIPIYLNDLDGFPILNPHYKQINVQEQEQRLDSPLNFYRKLLYLRKTNSVLNQGSFKVFNNYKTLTVNNLGTKMVTAYTRSNFWGKRYLIITNLDYQSQLVNINLGKYLTLDRLLLNTHQGVNYQNNLLELQPYQGIVVRV